MVYKATLLSLTAIILMSGCSFKSSGITNNNTYELRENFNLIRESHKGSYLITSRDKIEIEHNLLWHYGLNNFLSTDQIILLESTDTGYFTYGFGFKKFGLQIANNYFGKINNELSSDEFAKIIEFIYLRLTVLDEHNYVKFLKFLNESSNINISELNVDNFIDFYFSEKYASSKYYFINNEEKTIITKDFFVPYFYSIYIAHTLIKNNQLRVLNDFK